MEFSHFLRQPLFGERVPRAVAGKRKIVFIAIALAVAVAHALRGFIQCELIAFAHREREAAQRKLCRHVEPRAVLVAPIAVVDDGVHVPAVALPLFIVILFNLDALELLRVAVAQEGIARAKFHGKGVFLAAKLHGLKRLVTQSQRHSVTRNSIKILLRAEVVAEVGGEMLADAFLHRHLRPKPEVVARAQLRRCGEKGGR